MEDRILFLFYLFFIIFLFACVDGVELMMKLVFISSDIISGSFVIYLYEFDFTRSEC